MTIPTELLHQLLLLSVAIKLILQNRTNSIIFSCIPKILLLRIHKQHCFKGKENNEFKIIAIKLYMH